MILQIMNIQQKVINNKPRGGVLWNGDNLMYTDIITIHNYRYHYQQPNITIATTINTIIIIITH